MIVILIIVIVCSLCVILALVIVIISQLWTQYKTLYYTVRIPCCLSFWEGAI